MSKPTRIPEYVMLPADDYRELQNTAFSPSDPKTLSDRAASTAQTTIFWAAAAGAVTAGTWGWVKATDWLETRRQDRKHPSSAAKLTDINTAKK